MHLGELCKVTRNGIRISRQRLAAIGVDDGSRLWVRNLARPNTESNPPDQQPCRTGHIITSPIPPDSWPLTYRLEVRIRDGEGALASMLTSLPPDINILTAHCTPSGFYHATWIGLVERLPKPTDHIVDYNHKCKQVFRETLRDKDPNNLKDGETKEFEQAFQEVLHNSNTWVESTIDAIHDNIKDEDGPLYVPSLHRLEGPEHRHLVTKRPSNTTTPHYTCYHEFNGALNMSWNWSLAWHWFRTDGNHPDFLFKYDRDTGTLHPNDGRAYRHFLERQGFEFPFYCLVSFDRAEHFMRVCLHHDDGQHKKVRVVMQYRTERPPNAENPTRLRGDTSNLDTTNDGECPNEECEIAEPAARDSDTETPPPSVNSSGLLKRLLEDLANASNREGVPINLLKVSNILFNRTAQNAPTDINTEHGQITLIAEPASPFTPNKCVEVINDCLRGMSKKPDSSESESSKNDHPRARNSFIVKHEISGHTGRTLFISTRYDYWMNPKFTHRNKKVMDTIVKYGFEPVTADMRSGKLHDPDSITNQAVELIRECSAFLMILPRLAPTVAEENVEWPIFEYGVAKAINVPRKVCPFIHSNEETDQWKRKLRIGQDTMYATIDRDCDDNTFLENMDKAVEDLYRAVEEKGAPST